MIDVIGRPQVLRIVVSTEDLARACSFYRDLLGLKVRYQRADLVSLDLGGGQELLLHRRQVQRGDAAVAIGFFVDDVRAVVDRWREEGGEIVDEPVAEPWGEVMAVIRDADGHIVCVSEAAQEALPV